MHDSLKADCVSDADFFGDGCDPRPDIIIALGGDGTILSAVSFAAPAGIPVFGINLGAMGFLSAMTAADPSECVRMLKSGAYTVSERTMLDTEVCGKRYHALNEIVFYKRNVGKTVIVSVKVDGSVQEWTPMETEGWMKRLMTGKSITVSLKGKRCIGDEGNDYVYELSWKNGLECDAFFEWEFPSSGKISFNCVINVTTPGGGDSTNVDGLEFDIMSSGKPTYTPPVGAEG